jgi:hypothetical protein
MCPSSRRNLFNIVSKVSRYREAARFPCRTARKIPLLRRAKVVPINLPKEAFYRVAGENHNPQLASTVARINTICQGPDVRYLFRLLNTSGPQPNDQFTAQTRKTLREAKIHAEIQLVFYYELNASRLPPRVVCSSKDACFLCNVFILMHGKMHTPRYRGRLYPGWRLPSMPDLNDLDLRLNSALEDLIKDSLKILLSRQKKTIYPDPNESTLLTLPLSTSTLRTSALAEATEREEASAKTLQPTTQPGFGNTRYHPGTENRSPSQSAFKALLPYSAPEVLSPQKRMDFPRWACRTSLRRNYPPDAVLEQLVIRLQHVTLRN